MGLDMYMYAKYKGCNDTKSTGACGGMFPLAPKNTNKEEIGYWRKAYNINTYLLKLVNPDCNDDNCVDFRITKNQCYDILDHAEYMVKEGVENEMDLEPEDLEWEKRDWQDLADCMNKALELIKEHKARIYYYIWY